MNIQSEKKRCVLLKKLNKQLHAIENKILNKAKKLDRDLHEDLKTHKAGLIDFELELQVGFYIDGADDPIHEVEENLKNCSIKSKAFFLGRDDCYFHYPKNDFNSKNDCCGLFYLLYDKSDLSVSQILSIDTVFWDVIPFYQYGAKINYNNIFKEID